MVRGEKPITLGLMVREPQNTMITDSSALRGGVTTLEEAVAASDK